MWPFGKKKAPVLPVEGGSLTAHLGALSAVAYFLERETKPKVDVEEVRFVMTLDDGERLTFAMYGKVEDGTVFLASESLDHLFKEANARGFFRIKKDGTERWVPVRKVTQVTTTVWPREVPLEK